MACKVRIQPTAERELDAIVAYLAAFGPETASSFLDAWEEMLVSLRDGVVNYRLSRFLPLARLGYHSVPVKNYMVLFFKEGTDVTIAHIFHQSQDYARLVEEGL
jgi:plasmid stabilization system protein ParE